MKIKDAHDYALMKHRHPGNAVLAFDEPKEINAVVLFDRWRFRVVKQLTCEEFLDRVKEHKQHTDHVAAVAPMRGARLAIDEAEDKSEVPTDLKYFYAVEIV